MNNLTLGDSNICGTYNTLPFVESYYNRKGILLKSYSWLVKNAIGIIVLVHGLSAHLRLQYLRLNVNVVNNDYATLIDADNYYIYEDSWIEEFNKNGYSVYGIDLQGHGESNGLDKLPLHIDNFDDYVYDIIDYMRRINNSIVLEKSMQKNTSNKYTIENREELLPMYLVGLSMGGNIVLRTLEILGKSNEINSNLNIKGCISLAGMISVRMVGSIDSIKYRYFYLPVMKLFSRYFPTFRPGKKKFKFEKYPFVNDLLFYDKYRFKGRITNNLAREILVALDNLHNNIDDIPKNIPILFIHSINDCLCLYEGTVSFYNKLQIENKELYTLEDMDHVISMEPGNENVLKKILEWISNLYVK
ncbi:lysophospholipase, putative [Plasmodium reichenowi]|uniref:Lysophospholipase, putative n=1 Tax=Plasmodium reichenowi TaxID=5854 RepID=A0A060RU58_PLARE|nr:lysophospholipase, putative [Plasmodium reichenowi]